MKRLGVLVVCWSMGVSACEAEPLEPRFRKPKPTEVAKAAPAKPPEAPKAPVDAAQAGKRRVSAPTSPDPLGNKFPLAEATAGLPGKGDLRAKIQTDQGELSCTLYADKAPFTVANFVGLARGLRPFWDARDAAWVKRPLYDGTTFHRTIPDFMIQGGDHLGDGTGEVGYNLQDEIWQGMVHDRAGLLCMANRGPNTNGGQFFITDAATPHLTRMGTYTVFGACSPIEVVHRIAQQPHSNPFSERPDKPIGIRKVTIARGG
jgi:peptidyl-prolyl cis-trans isomerase A (cyclophilin A)